MTESQSLGRLDLHAEGTSDDLVSLAMGGAHVSVFDASARARAHNSARAKAHWRIAAQRINVLGLDRKIALLAAVPLLAGLTRPELTRLALQMHGVLVPANRRVVRQLEHPRRFGIIVSGALEARDQTSVKTDLGPGDYFGLEALGIRSGNHLPPVQTVVTVEPSLLLVYQTTPPPVTGDMYHEARFRIPLLAEQMAIEKILRRIRPLVEMHLIANLMLRLRTFSHLRTMLPVRLELAKLLRFVIYSANQCIIHEGQAPKDMSVYFLITGSCLIYVKDASKGEETQRCVGVTSSKDFGARLGQLSVFGDEPASASVITSSQCVCLVLDRAKAAAFAALMPEIKERAQIMSQEVRKGNLTLSTTESDEIKKIVATTNHKVNYLLNSQREDLRRKKNRKSIQESMAQLTLRTSPDLSLGHRVRGGASGAHGDGSGSDDGD